MPSPKLIIRRVVVEGELSLDQLFYPGLNIIHAVQAGEDVRSTNGCGKTSLVELIQHGFGRHHKSKAKFHFATIIDRINMLWIEFETRSGIYTIGRSLKDIFSAVRLHEGGYAPGIEKTPAEIVRLDDMSELMLRLTGIPKVAVNTRLGEPVPLSFPLLMRAFILHQEDSFAEILFKVEPEARKADIIGFLTGITPIDRFPLEEQISEVKLKISPLESYLKSVKRFLTENGVPTKIEADALVRKAQEELDIAREEQRSVQRQIIQHETVEQPGRTDFLRRTVLNIKKLLGEQEQNYFSVIEEENRLIELLASLRNDRQKSLHLQASSTHLSHIEFSLCPRCLQEITIEMHQREQSGRCSLCNRPMLVNSDTLPRKIPKTEDVDSQIEEVEELLTAVRNELKTYEERLSSLREQQRKASIELEAEMAVYVSPSVDQLIAQADIVSAKQVELSRAIHIYEQTLILEQLQKQFDELTLNLYQLEDELAEVGRTRKQRREILRQTYEKILKAVDFPKLQDVTIESSTLMPNINGELYTHQGTALKGLATVCYHLALFEMAQEEDTYFPQLLVIDSPNVGDLNEDNHNKLLNYLATIGNNQETGEDERQIILTTRHLPALLEPYVRERISNPDRMLLKER